MSGRNRLRQRVTSSNQNHNEQTEANPVNLNNVQNNNNANRNRRLKNEPKKGSCKKKTLTIILGLISSAIVLTLLYTFLYNTGKSFNSASEILRENIDVANTFLIHELQLSAFLIGEPLADLLKEKLRPVQERVASLKTQTMKYEKMEKITGGPTSFIESSLKELETIEDIQLAQLDEKVSMLLANEERQAKGLEESGKDIMARGHTILDTVDDPLLTTQDIHLTQTSDVDDATFDRLLTRHKLEDIINVISILANKLEKKEAAVQKLDILQSNLGVEDWLNDDVLTSIDTDVFDTIAIEGADLLEEVEELEEEVENEIKKNGRLYNFFLPLISRTMDKIEVLIRALIDYIHDKRSAYLKLERMVKEDIKTLKTRIFNLRYKYTKITPKSL